MKVLVCFKTIPDFSMLAGSAWEIDDGQSVDLEFVRRMFNCYDESGLEMALKLSDQAKNSRGQISLTALTIDDPGADLFLKHALALEYDIAIRIDPGQDIDLRFNALAVSCLISAFLEKFNPYQVVILGAQGGEGGNGQTGFLLAERLGWPCIRDVIDFKLTPSLDALVVTCREEDAVMVQTIEFPVVLVIGNAGESPYLRVPTLKQKLSAKGKSISVLSSADLDVGERALAERDKVLTCLEKEKARQACTFINGGTAEEKARQLFDLLLEERLLE